MRNITAARELSNITRTAFGPNGRNKLVLNHLEKLFLTSDAATIIREAEIVHPAAKLLVQASTQQETEQGDATNLVIIFGGELLAKAEWLLNIGVHPSDVVKGYEMAWEKARHILESLCIDSAQVANPKDKNQLENVIRTTLYAKQPDFVDHLTMLCLDAAEVIMPKHPANFNVDSVRVVKIMGGSPWDSRVVHGMVFGREPEGTVRHVSHAKVAVFTCPVDISQTETKGTVLIKSAEQMLDFSKGEERQMEQVVQELANAGVNVVVSGSGIGELALHYLNRYGMMVVKVLSKFDLRRLCRVIGATALARLGAPTPEEMGLCSRVETVEIGSDWVTVFRQESGEVTRTATIVLRGATQNLLDDMERAIDDAVNMVKASCKDGRVVAGAGACELDVAQRLQQWSSKVAGVQQLAARAYAEAFECIPNALAVNAGLDGTEVISNLYTAHQQYAKEHKDVPCPFGVHADSEDGNIESSEQLKGVKDVVKSGIVEPMVVKENAIRLATDAALTILRVDQIIMSKPAGGPKPPKKNGGNWDED